MKDIELNKLSFRKALIWIKKQNNTDQKRFLLITGAIFITSLILSLVVDYFTPFYGLWMFIRSIILIPLSLTIFTLSYSLSLYLHKRMIENNPEWVSFRARFSPTWRNRISIIIGAFLLLIIYVSQEKVGYTLVSSTIIAVVIALFAFMRKTKDEKIRSELGVPDERDIEYKKLVEELEEEQKRSKQISLQKKSKKKYDRWGIKDKNYVEEIDEDYFEEISLSSVPDEFDLEVHTEEEIEE